jgi:integrase
LLSRFIKALQQGLFEPANPVTAAAIPDAPPANETHAYSLADVTQMVAALPEPAATVVLTAAFTGLRRGEIRGMRWENLESGKPLAFYRVSQSIWKGIVTEPKTAKSKAPVPIIGALAKEAGRTSHTLRRTSSWAEFTNAVGNTIDLNDLYRRTIKPILQAAGIGCWDLEHYLTHRRKEIDRKYDYRYSHLFVGVSTDSRASSLHGHYSASLLLLALPPPSRLPPLSW